MLNRYAPFPFLTVGIVFIAIDATGQHTLIYVGIVFLVLALVMFVKFRKPN
jgi:LPXTG-motif cell wall-anchored protein